MDWEKGWRFCFYWLVGLFSGAVEVVYEPTADTGWEGLVRWVWVSREEEFVRVDATSGLGQCHILGRND